VPNKDTRQVETIDVLKEPVRATITVPPHFEYQSFTKDMFLEWVIRKRTPVILRNATKDFDPAIWSTEFLKKNYENVDLSVRYQGIDATDLSSFMVLKDQKKKLGWYFTYAEAPDFPSDPDFEVRIC